MYREVRVKCTKIRNGHRGLPKWVTATLDAMYKPEHATKGMHIHV